MLVPEDTEASKEALGVANTEEEDRQVHMEGRTRLGDGGEERVHLKRLTRKRKG